MVSKYLITYRCGHQKEDFIYASGEYVHARLAEYARQLCPSCQVAQEQQQFEEALQAKPVVYNQTDQNGHFLTATRTRPGFRRITVRDAGQALLREDESEIAQVTADLYQRYYKHLYRSAKQYIYKPFC